MKLGNMGMKLSQNEKLALTHLQLRANLSVSESAKICGLKPHTIRRCLDSLLGKGIIKRTPYINHSAMGYEKFKVLFSIHSCLGARKDEFIRVLRRSKNITHLAEVGGQFDFEMTFTAKHIQSLADFFDSISEMFGRPIREKSVSTILGHELYGCRFLIKDKVPERFLGWTAPSKLAEFDRIDLAVLSVLVNNSNRSQSELARQLGMPLTTVAYRIQQLEAKGIICGYMFLYEPADFGMRTFEVVVYSQHLTSSGHAQLRQYFRRHRNVDSFLRTVGSWEYQLTCHFEDHTQAAEFSQELYTQFGEQIDRVAILPHFKTHTVAAFPFIA